MTTVVDGLDLEVRRGEVFGFLGPNGAGKTTAMAMLLGLVAPHAGRIEILGHDARQPRGGAAAGRGDRRDTDRVPRPVTT